ncbi:unnamed protein product [Echinostoma caproni]|uniref:Zonadhesin n=1 Tax=Echinostoma caproni TaxID=27848 RepID=A0A183AJ65_9TREM|nr:unnamed protein product [Echinostoma caproni]
MDVSADVVGHTRVHGNEYLTERLANSVLNHQLEKNRPEGHAKFLSDRIHYSKDSPTYYQDGSRDIYYDDVRKVYTFPNKPNLIMLAIDDPGNGRVYQTFKVANPDEVSRIKRRVYDGRRGRYARENGYEDPEYRRSSRSYRRRSSRTPSPVYVETLAPVQSVPVMQRVQQVPVVERVETVPVVERVETVPVMERIETVPVVERIERPQRVERVQPVPVVERVETVPVIERVERTPVMERVQRVPVVERVETVPVVERVETVPVMERIETVPVVERIERPQRVERVQPMPIVERVETVPVIERIEQTPVIERVQRRPTIIRERSPSPVYVTPMPQPPQSYVRSTEIYVPEPEPEPIVYKSVQREVPVAPTYVERVPMVERVETVPVVERVETVPVVERVETVPVVERIEHTPVVERVRYREQTPSPVYVQTVQTVPQPVSTTYVRPSEVVFTEPAAEPVRYRRSSRSRYEPGYRSTSMSPAPRRSSVGRRPYSPSYDYESEDDDGSIILKRVSKVEPS